MPRIRRKDKSNQRFGRWTVLEYAYTKNRQAYWLCRCDCGTERIVNACALSTGKSRSCGCGQKESVSNTSSTHRMSDTRLFNIHHNMKARCYNPKNPEYNIYGGKGIKICDEWIGKGGFENFVAWALENGYEESLTIDRIDFNGNYEPSNCRWATYAQQNNNKSVNHLITYNGETHNVTEWSKITGISRETLFARIRYGWDVDRLFIPSHRRKGD